MRRIQGLPLKIISAASVGGPIKGYANVGGWEGEAFDYLNKHGGVSVEFWPPNALSRSYFDKPECVADRANHVALELFDIGSNFDKWMTLALNTKPGAFAKNSMSHVMQSCDGVKIESGSYGLRFRNSWGHYGAKNDLGFYGYGVMREGNHYDSGWGLRQVTASLI